MCRANWLARFGKQRGGNTGQAVRPCADFTQTALAVVVDPGNESPIGSHLDDEDGEIGQVESAV